MIVFSLCRKDIEKMNRQIFIDWRRERYLGGRYGQKEETRERYRDAIEACASVMYLGKTLAAIARLYGHQPEAFRMMMKRHYPDILAERERMRHVMGLRRTVPQDVRPRTEAKYAPALALLEAGKDYDEAARETGVDREQLLSWMKHNRPDVHEMVMQTRWVTLIGGVRLSREKWEAYQQAAQEWRQSKEPLKHVAERHGLRDVRLREFLRRIGETV